MKKKITIVFVIILILFNFIFADLSFAINLNDFPNMNEILADSDNGETTLEKDGNKLTVSVPKRANPNLVGVTLINSAINVVSIFRSKLFANLLNVFVFDNSNVEDVVDKIDEKTTIFSVYDLVMGKYELFNADFSKVDDKEEDDSILEDMVVPLGDKIKQKVRDIYKLTRALSIAISLFVLIYIGIRIAISTIESQQVKYKTMLMSWVESMVILFLMHFIIVILSFVVRQGLVVINNVAEILKIDNIEVGIVKELFNIGANATDNYINKGTASAVAGIGFQAVGYLITMIIFLYYQIKFFKAYAFRFCEIAFLITIGPLVTITYPIDKAGDGKAQAFTAWFRELTIKYTIQLVHATTYCVLIGAVGAIAQAKPIVAAILIGQLSRAEKIVRSVFEVNDKGFERARVPFIDKHILGKK